MLHRHLADALKLLTRRDIVLDRHLAGQATVLASVTHCSLILDIPILEIPILDLLRPACLRLLARDLAVLRPVDLAWACLSTIGSTHLLLALGVLRTLSLLALSLLALGLGLALGLPLYALRGLRPCLLPLGLPLRPLRALLRGLLRRSLLGAHSTTATTTTLGGLRRLSILATIVAARTRRCRH